MKDEEILSILDYWNFWGKEQDTGIERANYLNTILPFLKTNNAVVITGVRRSGKSVIMTQVAKRLIDSGLDPKSTLIINFEDYRFYNISLILLQQVYELYLRKLSPVKDRMLFLDEIHKIEGWERFVRTLLDKKEAKIIVSGSNSNLIAEEYATLLTGRHVKILVFPLSFKELLQFKNVDISTELKIVAEKIKIKRFLDEYLKFGGFPEVVLADEKAKEKLIADYIDSILTKDVAERHKIKRKTKLMELARYYLTNVANKISFNKLKEPLELPLRTIERFSYYLEEAYLLFFLKRFSFKVKEQSKANRKVYAVDTGLANIYGFRASQDIGRIIENAVFIEMLKKNANNPNFEIYYWQNPQGKEVDFVIKHRSEIIELMQVCYDAENIETKKRELNALVNASEELKCKNLTVITWDYEESEKIKGKKIKFIPLWKWLLEMK